MRRSSIFLVTIFFLASSACGQKCMKQPTSFIYRDYKNVFALYIEDMATLPGDTVFLGGRYHDGANTVHPALLTSRDAGLTWEHHDFTFAGSSIQNFQTYGKSDIWAIVVFKQEGADAPQYLLRSADAGNNWCVLSLESICGEGQIGDFRFFDSRRGLISLSGNMGQSNTYYTKNGGETWEPLWESDKNRPSEEVETDYRYPGFAELPLNAPLWTKDIDFYKITGVLRIRRETGDYRIEKYSYLAKQEWEKTSVIPFEYIVRENRLLPLSKKQ